MTTMNAETFLPAEYKDRGNAHQFGKAFTSLQACIQIICYFFDDDDANY